MAEYFAHPRRARMTQPGHPIAKPRDYVAHDPKIDKVQLLLQGGQIVDSSRAARALTSIGTPSVDSSVFLYNDKSSYLFAGSDGITSTASMSDFNTATGSGDLDVTAFVRLSANATGVYYTIFEIAYTVAAVPKSCVVRWGDNGFGNRLQCAVDESATATVWSASSSYTKSAMVLAWHKIRFKIVGGTKASLYVDDDRVQLQNSIAAGAFVDEFTPTQGLNNVTDVTVGSTNAGTRGFVGNIQEIRFTCLDSRAFALPTEPFPTT